MPHLDHPMQWAEAILIATGVILLLTWIINTTQKQQWREKSQIPPPPPNDSSPVDLWLALAIFLLVPGATSNLIGLYDPRAIPASQPHANAVASTPQIAATTISLCCISVGLLFIGRRPFRSFALWGLNLTDLPRRFAQALLAYVMIWPVCVLVLELSGLIFQLLAPNMKLPEHETIALLLSNQSSTLAKSLLTINAIFLAAFTEELLFRGILLTFLRSLTGPWPAIILSGVAFGFLHYPLWHFIPPLAFLGIALGYLYARTNSLSLVICLHMIFNGKTLLWLALGAAN
jgi:membrane protease YdiL (CAAX protease family)